MKPVLYADDDANDVFFMQHVWESLAIPNPLIDVNDGNAAIDYLAGNGAYADRDKYPLPCLLLLDLNMPGKNGFEVLRWVRGNGELKTLPVVIVTGSNQERDVEMAQELGITDYLVKPAALAELARQVAARKDLWLPETAASTRSELRRK